MYDEIVLIFVYTRLEVFDADKLGKDKSLGKVEVDPRDFDQPRWIPLQGVKSGELLINSEILAPGQLPSSYAGDNPIKGNYPSSFSEVLG